MTMRGAVYELTGRIQLDLPPDQAFRLFTARGEEDWVAGWRPRFPVPTEDDTIPGTVFETDAHGEVTTWVVVDSERPRRIRYARVTPPTRAGTVHGQAGTVTVTLDEAGAGSEVTVTYALTPLTEAATAHLDQFAARYPAFLQSWQDGIEAWLRRER